MLKDLLGKVSQYVYAGDDGSLILSSKRRTPGSWSLVATFTLFPEGDLGLSYSQSVRGESRYSRSFSERFTSVSELFCYIKVLGGLVHPRVDESGIGIVKSVVMNGCFNYPSLLPQYVAEVEWEKKFITVSSLEPLPGGWFQHQYATLHKDGSVERQSYYRDKEPHEFGWGAYLPNYDASGEVILWAIKTGQEELPLFSPCGTPNHFGVYGGGQDFHPLHPKKDEEWCITSPLEFVGPLGYDGR